ncbi:MAG: response regulator [Alphaproteobacteria bacterium]|jgi:hypothetical protein|nr:response regulator [Alphaproteobacteria bacterium]
MSGSNNHNVDQMERTIEGEFVDEVRDVCNTLDVLLGNLRSGTAKPADALATLRRSFASIEARSKGVDQPLISILAFRATDYLADIKDLSAGQIDDLQTFVDRMRAVADGEVAKVEAAPQMVRELPAKRATDFDIGDVKQLNVESMVVAPDRMTQRVVSRELAACGYRVSSEKSALRALELISRTRPDFVIVSAVLDELSGIDVASALTAMPSTRNIPIALLTSYTWGHPSLHDLPTRVAIIRKGNSFGSDLAEFLGRFGVT